MQTREEVITWLQENAPPRFMTYFLKREGYPLKYKYPKAKTFGPPFICKLYNGVPSNAPDIAQWINKRGILVDIVPTVCGTERVVAHFLLLAFPCKCNNCIVNRKSRKYAPLYELVNE